MSDVFISYARSTEAQANRLTEALRDLGYKVWRDDQLPAHLAYGEVIEERLHEAKAVVVIWSADALQSVWVRSEADRARALRKLVQTSVDGSRLPMPFDQIQCADLADWTGEAEHFGFRKVTESVAHLVAERSTPTRTRRKPAAVAATISAAQPLPAEAREGAAPALAARPPPAYSPSDVHDDPTPVLAAAPPPAEARSEVREGAASVLTADPAPAAEPNLARAATMEAPLSAPATRRAQPRVALIGIGAAAAAILIGGVFFAARGVTHQAVGSTPSSAAPEKPTLALALAPTPTNVPYEQISQAAAALASDARSRGRPASETNGLAQLATRIDSVLAQLKGASTRPGGAGSVAELTTQLNQTAAEGAQGEAAILSRAGDSMASEVRNTLRGDGAPPGATAALAALHDSTQKLNAAKADTGNAKDAAGSLAALHATFAAWGEVRANYATATALYPPLLRARFGTAAGAANAAAQRVIAAAKGPKPWLFASGNQKRAYAAQQANAATAKADLGRLEALAQTVSSSSRESELRAAIKQAGEIRSSLEALAASSNSSGG